MPPWLCPAGWGELSEHGAGRLSSDNKSKAFSEYILLLSVLSKRRGKKICLCFGFIFLCFNAFFFFLSHIFFFPVSLQLKRLKHKYFSYHYSVFACRSQTFCHLLNFGLVQCFETGGLVASLRKTDLQERASGGLWCEKGLVALEHGKDHAVGRLFFLLWEYHESELNVRRYGKGRTFWFM